MTRKSVAAMKPAKKDEATSVDTETVLNEWRRGELYKIDSMKMQLTRPDSYLRIRKNLSEVGVGEATVKEVEEVVNYLLDSFSKIRKLVEELTVESAVENIDNDPFQELFKMVDPKKMSWRDIIVENIYFETIRPFAEHYFSICEQLYVAVKNDGDAN